MDFTPHTEEDLRKMKMAIGIEKIDELFSDIPEEVKFKGKLNLPEGVSEQELVNLLKQLSQKNTTTEDYINFLGAGAYEHFIPSVIDHVISRSEFYTSYTPYQPEISQGMLQAIFEYQTMICELTGMEVSNASLYDGASALAEAVEMACNFTGNKKILVSRTIHPEYLQVVKTYTQFRDIEIIEVPWVKGNTDLEALIKNLDDKTAAYVIQYPNFFGIVEDLDTLQTRVEKNNALFIVVADPISLALLKPPGDFGADIVVGEGQSLGNPLQFGGPYLGFMAAKKKLIRKMPGRIVGETKDVNNVRGYVLTLQTREQHIRRERATSNICSNEALCALAAAVYLTYMGKKGLRAVAEQCLLKANYLYENICKLEHYHKVFDGPFFKEFVVKTDHDVEYLNKELQKHRIFGGLNLERFYPELKNHLLVCVTETKTKQELDYFLARLEGIV